MNFSVDSRYLSKQARDFELSWQQMWPIRSGQSGGSLYQPTGYEHQAVGKKYQSHVRSFDLTNYGNPFVGLFLLICRFCTVLLFLGLGRCERGKNGTFIFCAVLLAFASCAVCALWPMLADKISNRRMGLQQAQNWSNNATYRKQATRPANIEATKRKIPRTHDQFNLAIKYPPTLLLPIRGPQDRLGRM